MNNRLTIYLLTLGTFLTGTASLVIVGIIDLIANDLQISVALTGQLITAYALAFAIGAPLLISYTIGQDRKKILLITLALFMFGNLLTILASNFIILFIARLFLGLGGGAYLIICLTVAAKLVPPEKIGSAMGTIMIGLSSSLVLGVPAGIFITQYFAWRTVFILLVIFTALITVGIIRLLPSIEGEKNNSLKQQLSLFKNGKVMSGLAITLFWVGGYLSTYTYITPFLNETTNLNATMITLVMVGLGIFSMIGSHVGGLSSDRYGPKRMIVITLSVHALLLVSLTILSSAQAFMIMIAMLWMLSSWMCGPAIQSYLVRQAPESSSTVLSLNTSVLQLGSALGASWGGLIINTQSAAYIPIFASILIVIGIIVALISFSIRNKTKTQGA